MSPAGLAGGFLRHTDAAGRRSRQSIPSGHAALDAALPDGGWPRGGVVELLPARQSADGMALLMPSLARLSALEMAWVVCIAPPLPPYAPAWAAAGVALPRLLVSRAAGTDVARACLLSVASEGVGAIVAWLPAADPALLDRLQRLAEINRTLLFLFRPAGCGGGSPSASLRIGFDAEAAGRFSLRLSGHRADAASETLALDCPVYSPVASSSGC